MAMSNPKMNSYTIIKGRFKAMDTNTFGLILIYVNNDIAATETVNIVASHFSSMYESDPRQKWSEIEERIKTLKFKGEFATSVSNDTQVFVDGALKGARSDEIYNLVKANATSKIESLLAMLLVKPLADKNIRIEIALESASAEQIQAVKQEREMQSAEEVAANEAAQAQEDIASGNDSQFDVGEGAVVLNINLVLAPVSGIPIFELQPNDRIMVKIDPNSKRGMYFIDLLHAKGEKDVLPVPAVVTEVNIGKANEYVILVRIGEGIYGTVSETEQVKIKRFDPNTDKNAAINTQKNLAAAGYSKNPQASKQDKSIRNLYWLLYVGGFIVLAILLVIVTTFI